MRGVDEGWVRPTTYVVSFPRVLKLVKCPVPGCLEVVHSAGQLRENFMYRNFRSQVVVVQEVEELLPRCDLCGMQMPAGRLVKNLRTQRYNKYTQMRCRIRDVAIANKCTKTTFSLTGEN